MEKVEPESKNIVRKEADAVDECYRIAESMIEEIQLLRSMDSSQTSRGRLKGAMKRKLLRHVRMAKELGMAGHA